MKFNTKTLTTIESLFNSAGYRIRYEKGNFKSGSCVVWQKKMIVISKFYATEEKIKALADIIAREEFPKEGLSNEQLSFLTKITQKDIFEQQA